MTQIPGGLQGPDGFPYDTIRLTGIRAIGYHGVLDHEKRDGQQFAVDVTLHVDTRAAAAGDELSATTSYADVAADVVDIVTGPSADLIETVAERIAATVLTNPGVHGVDVVVHKPEAPIPVPFDDACVAIRRDRTVRRPAVAPVPIGGSAEEASDDLPPAPVVVGHVSLPEVPAPATPAVPDVPAPASDDRPAVAAESDEPPAFVPAAAPTPVEIPETAVHAVGTGAAPVEPDDAGTGPVAVDSGPVPTPGRPQDVFDAVPGGFVDVVLALGSNIGDSKATLREAVTDLDRIQGLELREVAPLARTGAVGGPEQDDYLNTVVLGRTTLSARALLQECQAVETAHGRERAERWGPRTLDVDMITYGDVVDEAADLTLPHPRARERAFVLAPWAQVDPDAELLGLGGGPVVALAETAPDAGGIRWLALDWLTDPTPGESEAQPVPATPAPVERDLSAAADGPPAAIPPGPAPVGPAPVRPDDGGQVSDRVVTPPQAPTSSPTPVPRPDVSATPARAPWAPPENFQPIGYGRPAERDVERPRTAEQPVISDPWARPATGPQPTTGAFAPTGVQASTGELPAFASPQRRRVLGPPDGSGH